MDKNTITGLALGIGIAATVGVSAYVLNNHHGGMATDGNHSVAVKTAANDPECRDETVTTTHSTEDHRTAGVLIGGALGGLAGNQFGKGSGNSAATAAGAVAGAMIGQNQGKPRTYQESHVVRRCH